MAVHNVEDFVHPPWQVSYTKSSANWLRLTVSLRLGKNFTKQGTHSRDKFQQELSLDLFIWPVAVVFLLAESAFGRTGLCKALGRGELCFLPFSNVPRTSCEGHFASERVARS